MLKLANVGFRGVHLILGSRDAEAFARGITQLISAPNGDGVVFPVEVAEGLTTKNAPGWLGELRVHTIPDNECESLQVDGISALLFLERNSCDLLGAFAQRYVEGATVSPEITELKLGKKRKPVVLCLLYEE